MHTSGSADLGGSAASKALANTNDATELREFVVDLYDSIGDRQRFDAHLDSDITIWESDAAGLLHGLPALDALRDERAARPRPGSLTHLAPEDVLVSVWHDTAVARYILRAQYDGGPDDVFRVTDVLRRTSDGWRIVHHHAEDHRSLAK